MEKKLQPAPAAGDAAAEEPKGTKASTQKRIRANVNADEGKGMKQDEEPASWPVVRQLFHLQQSLHAPKNIENREGQFNFRSLEGIIQAAKPILARMGCVLSFTEDIEEHCGQPYVVSTATLANLRGDSISSKAFAREDATLPGMCSAQISGSCITYARKYAAGGLLAIDNTRLAESVEIDSLSKSAVAADKEQPQDVPAPMVAPASAVRPILRRGMKGWAAEVMNLTEWRGTKADYLSALESRYEVAEEDLAILLSRRSAPFAAAA